MSKPTDRFRILGPFYGLLVALRVFTRLPVPDDLTPSGRDMGLAAPWLPLCGALIGGSLAISALGAMALGLVPGIAAPVLVLLGLSMSGAVYEDGLSRAADAFGGTWGRQQALDAMKRPSAGTFGTLALFLLLIGRVSALWSLELVLWPAALICAWTAAGVAALVVARLLPPASGAEPRSAPFFEGLGWLGTLIGVAMGIFGGWIVFGTWGAGVVATAVLVAAGAALYLHARVGGLTYAGIGMTAVLGELGVLIAFAVTHPASRSPFGA